MGPRKQEAKGRNHSEPSKRNAASLRSDTAKKSVSGDAKRASKGAERMTDKKRKLEEETPKTKPAKRVKAEESKPLSPVAKTGIAKKKTTSPPKAKSAKKAPVKKMDSPSKSKSPTKKTRASAKAEPAADKAELPAATKVAVKGKDEAKGGSRRAPAARKSAEKATAGPPSRKSSRAASVVAEKSVKEPVRSPVAKKLPKPSPIKRRAAGGESVRRAPSSPAKSRAKLVAPSKGIQKKRISTPKRETKKRAESKPKPKTRPPAAGRRRGPAVKVGAIATAMFAPGSIALPPGKTLPARSEMDLSKYSYGEPIDSATGKLDLVFCLDCTGSMSSVIRACQASIVSLADSLTKKEGQDVRFCLIPYRDHSVGEEFCTRVYPFTRDVKQMQANVDAQSANGGGDTPEAVTAALYEAVCLDWRDDAAKLVVFMADAGPHGLGEGFAFPEGDPDGKDPLVLAREMQGMGISVYSLVSGGTPRTRHFFAAIAAMTGGQSVDLSNAALLGDAILGGAQESLDMEARMAAVRARLAAATTARGAPLTEDEAAEEARAAVDEVAGAGAGADGKAARPRAIPDDRVITIPPERLEQARRAASIVELRQLWSDGAAPAAGSAAAARGGEEGLVRRLAAMAAAREARPTGKVLIECVLDGKKVRARVASDGYNPEKNCQFPRDIREEGRRFWADGVVDAGSFYRVTGKIVPADD